jgi:hypothetical protein
MEKIMICHAAERREEEKLLLVIDALKARDCK